MHEGEGSSTTICERVWDDGLGVEGCDACSMRDFWGFGLLGQC